MKIDWDQSVAGLSLMEIRDVLRFVARPGLILCAGAIADRLAPTRREWSPDFGEIERLQAEEMARSERLLKALAASGLIEIPDDMAITMSMHGGCAGYGLTAAGFGLVRATKTKRIARRSADAAVKLLREAVERIRSDPTLMYDVEELAIYGSYLTDSEDLGDVDVAYALTGRWCDKEDYRRRKEAFELAHEPPRSQRHVYEYQYTWDHDIVKRMLRPKACIQLTAMYHVKELGCAMLRLHPDETLVPAREGYVFDRSDIRLVEDDGAALARIDAEIARIVEAKKAERARETETILADPSHPQHEWIKMQQGMVD